MNEIRTNQQAVDLRAAMLTQQIEQAENLKEEMAKHFWPVIGTANQVAYMAIDDAVECMKAEGMFKHQEKQKALQAIEAYQKYERAAWQHFHDLDDERYNLWQDLIGRAAEKLQPDVQKLFFAVKNVIDKANVRHSVALAHIQTALALITLATLLFDTMAKGFQKQTMFDITSMFAGGRITAVESSWRVVGELTGKQVIPNVNLRDDESCILGIKVILARYEAADFLNEAAAEALHVNPNIKY